MVYSSKPEFKLYYGGHYWKIELVGDYVMNMTYKEEVSVADGYEKGCGDYKDQRVYVRELALIPLVQVNETSALLATIEKIKNMSEIRSRRATRIVRVLKEEKELNEDELKAIDDVNGYDACQVLGKYCVRIVRQELLIVGTTDALRADMEELDRQVKELTGLLMQLVYQGDNIDLFFIHCCLLCN